MPMPKPKKNENKDDWMDRCMGDDVMVSEFEDEKQRAAVCNQIWRDKDKKSMSKDRELRYLPFEDWELREEEDKPPRLEGYASVFDQETEIFGMWREKIAPGAFKKTITEHDIRALWNHNTDLPLGRNKAKTLELAEDKKGLRSVIHPPDTQAGRDAVTSIKRGDVTQMSIAFQVIKQEWYIPEDKKILPLRTIKEMKLFEVSPVTFPAFEQTEIQARSLMIETEEPDPRDEALRLSLMAERGLPLTAEQRQTIAAAVELYQPYLLEPESDENHSSMPDTEPEAEPVESHSEPEPVIERDPAFYSAEERERRLKAISESIYGNKEKI